MGYRHGLFVIYRTLYYYYICILLSGEQTGDDGGAGLSREVCSENPTIDFQSFLRTTPPLTVVRLSSTAG